jgi:DNA repair photolyase
MPSADLRWPLADEPSPQLVLFDDLGVRRVGRGEYRGLEFLEVRARTIINTLPAGPLPFRHTINAYRGCSHACAYCFARPTHEYLGLDAGTDFDTKIVVKINAVERARAETDPTVWAAEGIAMGTNTDPYQPAEGKYRLTRGLLEVLVERRNPFSVLTKSPLVLRDLDLLECAMEAGIDFRVDLSVPTLDEAVWRMTEPGTPHPRKRIDALARLRASGVASGVVMGPVLPGISDRPEQLQQVVKAALAADASSITPIALHLKPGVKEHFLGWLGAVRPELLGLHQSRYDGRSYAPRAVRTLLQRRVRQLVAQHAAVDHPARRRRLAPVAADHHTPNATSQQTLDLA